MKIVQIPKPVLAKACAPVKAADLKDGTYAKLFESMRKDMITNHGIGLAANQVGKDVALFVIDKNLATQENIPDAFANPQITEYGKEEESMEEGCLSIVGFWVPIIRSKKIMFKALDEHGKKIKFKAKGLLARVLQHETDHLTGITIKDRSAKTI